MSNPKIVWSDDVNVDFYKPEYIAPKCVVGLDRDGVINQERISQAERVRAYAPE